MLDKHYKEDNLGMFLC